MLGSLDAFFERLDELHEKAARPPLFDSPT